MIEFVILSSHLPHRLLWQDKGYIDLSCDDYLKESSTHETRQIFVFHWMTNT